MPLQHTTQNPLPLFNDRHCAASKRLCIKQGTRRKHEKANVFTVSFVAKNQAYKEPVL
jgi:hypothetical protein